MNGMLISASVDKEKVHTILPPNRKKKKSAMYYEHWLGGGGVGWGS